MISEFKAFIMKGNVLELAVAVILGAAFGMIVSTFTQDIIAPIVGLLLGGVNLSDFVVTIKDAVMDGDKVVSDAVNLGVGKLIQNTIDFLITAFVLFLVIKGYNNSQKKAEEAPAAPPAPSNEEVLLSEIRDLLKKQ